MFIFPSVSLGLEDTMANILLQEMSELFPSMFSRILWFHDLHLSLLIYFEFILVCGVSWWSSFMFLHVPVQCSQHHLLNRLSLLHCVPLSPLSNTDYKGVGLPLGSLFHLIDLYACSYASPILMTVAL